jgi:hypothetical protein
VHLSIQYQRFGNRLWVLLRNRWTLAILVCLFVINARLYTIKRFGVQEPYMDSFSEVHDYKAAAENNYGAIWQRAFQLHNEHRIVLTHWTNVGLFVLNQGKWDLLVEACLNAILAGLVVAALFAGHRYLLPGFCQPRLVDWPRGRYSGLSNLGLRVLWASGSPGHMRGHGSPA